MMWHPLDGNMIAADRHYGRGDDPQEGGKTACCEFGYWEYPEDDDSDDAPLLCSDCRGEAHA